MTVMDPAIEKALSIAKASNLEVLEAGAILSHVLEFLETVQASDEKEKLVKRINDFLKN